jgi:hypothetical protein
MPRQALIAQPLPLVECPGKLIIFIIERSVFERQPAHDGGQDEDAGADLDRRAQLDVDLVWIHENLVSFRKGGRGSDVEQEVDDVAVLDDVLFALAPQLTELTGFSQTTGPDQIVVTDHFGSNETALNV